MKKYASDQEAKQQILDVGKRIYEHGFVASNDGNISCRVGVNEFWVTPTGVSKGFMTEEMLIKIDKDGNVLEGSHKPSSEMKIQVFIAVDALQHQKILQMTWMLYFPKLYDKADFCIDYDTGVCFYY